MSWEAQKYVLSLGRRVTRIHHHLLLVLACHHQAQRETIWPSQETLAEEMVTDKREIRRVTAELEATDILTFIPGLGRGNRGRYHFPELEEKGAAQPSFPVENGEIKGGRKGGRVSPQLTKNSEASLPHIIITEPFTESLTEPDSSSRIVEKGKTIASSSPSVRDDDAGKFLEPDRSLKPVGWQPLPKDVNAVLEAFEQSAVTKPTASVQDRDTACRLLVCFTVDQIKYGILLGGARRSASQMRSSEDRRTPVQNLAYFENCIAEVVADGGETFSASYEQYLRHVLRKNRRKEPQSEIA